MIFQYLESTLHTLVVAMSDKPRTSFQVVRNNLCKMVCINLVNRSILGCVFSSYNLHRNYIKVIYINFQYIQFQFQFFWWCCIHKIITLLITDELMVYSHAENIILGLQKGEYILVLVMDPSTESGMDSWFVCFLLGEGEGKVGRGRWGGGAFWASKLKMGAGALLNRTKSWPCGGGGGGKSKCPLCPPWITNLEPCMKYQVKWGASYMCIQNNKIINAI